MDTETFEQIVVQEDMINAPQFLKDGQNAYVLINGDTDKPMGVELPEKIVLEVKYSEPGMKGDTATKTLKPATVETGAKVMVPLFISVGEMIKVDTRNDSYLGREN